jgi:hypothetical protein
MLSILSFHQPLLFRWQMTEGAIATTVTTIMFRTHPQHLSNCWSSKLNFLGPCSKSWYKCKTSTNWCNQRKQDPHQGRERVTPRMMLVQHRRSMQQKRQHLITKKVLRQLKQPQCVSIVDKLVILPIDAPIDVSVLLLHRTPTIYKF